MNIDPIDFHFSKTGAHVVQFYEDDSELVHRLAGFVAEGIKAGEAVIVIATQVHLDVLRAHVDRGTSVGRLADAEAQDQCILLDAASTMRSFMRLDTIDEQLFNALVDNLIMRARRGGTRRIRVFGEMVALLCAEGRPDIAIHLEERWNLMTRRHSFFLLCGYPTSAFSRYEAQDEFDTICRLHSGVLPCGHQRDGAKEASDESNRALARLQQKASALELEMQRRQQVEQTLIERERILTERTEALLEANERLQTEIEKRRDTELELLHAQHVLVSAQRMTRMGSWEMDFRTNKVHGSDEVFRIYGLSPQSIQLTLNYCLGIVHPDDREASLLAVAATREQKLDYSVEKRVILPDGSIRHLVSKGKPVLDDDGNCTAVIGAIMDVTERKLAEEALGRSETRFRSLVNLSSDIYWEQNEHLRFTELSERGLNKMGLEVGTLLGLTPWEAAEVYPDKFERVALETRVAARLPFHDFEYCVLDANKTRKYLQISGEPIFDSNGCFKGYRGVGKDITKRKQAEEALRQSRDDLRRLAAHQEKIKEEERKRIAREVHDELGGLLTGLKAYITVSMERAERAGQPADKLLRDASNLADIGIESVRRIVTDLRPSVLDQLGVWAAIEWQADQIKKRTNLTCECMIANSATTLQLDSERGTMLFRIVQEALTNVVRHAQATAIRIGVSRQENSLIVEIEDDGKGIEGRCLRNNESWGIHGMYERVRYFGGDLKITGKAGQGTTVLLHLPLEAGHGA